MSSNGPFRRYVSFAEALLDLRKLRLLRELADRGTIAAVAEALAYTPSAVSQQLSALEREAGVPLLEKAGRRLRLTDAGLALAEHATALLARAEQAEAELERVQGEVRGTVRIAAFQTAALAFLPEVLRRVADRHPDLRVEYVEADAEEALPALALGELDLVVAEEYEHAPRPHHPGLAREPLRDDPILVALAPGHPLARRRRVALTALADERWAVPREGTGFAGMVVHACRWLGGFDPDIRHRSNDLRILIALAGSGDAAALVPALGHEEGTPGVALREIAERRLRRSVFSTHRRAAAERPTVAALRRILREVALDSPARQ
jgi:DNA-binding transcriptional LysR family regulator